MSFNSDLFIWKSHKGIYNKKPDNYEEDLKYWQSQANKAADNAIKGVLSNSENPSKIQSSLVDENIYNEAKHLVKSWLTNKTVYGDFDSRQSFLELSCDEPNFSVPTKIEVHREWQHLVEKIDTKEDFKEELESYLSTDNNDIKEDKKLKAIMSNLHKKTFVDPSKLRKIDTSKSVDMKKRIENRQEDVKKKREDRLKKEEALKLEKLAEKEAKFEAMKLLKEEKKQKELSIKKEEELILIEMNKIRCEIQKKREQEMLELRKLKETKELLTKQEKKINSSRQQEEFSKILDCQIVKNVSDRHEMIAEFVEKKFKMKNLQLVNRCFKVWKDEFVSTKLKIQRARIWFHWKISRKLFRSWFQYTRTRKINLQIDIDQQKIKLIQMKECMAVDFWKRNLLKRCIINWSLYVIDTKEDRWCRKLEEMRKKKMIAYVEALREKVLENQEKIDILTMEGSSKVHSKDPNAELSEPKVETERLIGREKQVQPINTRCKSARQTTSVLKPKEAWQITKKDVYLPIDQLIDNSTENKRDFGSHNLKSLKQPKIVNSYAHRDAAQKELIKQQQLKIKDQQRLLDEIKSNLLFQEIRQDNFGNSTDSGTENQPLSPSLQENDLQSVSAKSQLKPRNKFVIQMEARAKEREKIKVERLEKQKKLEDEKKKLLAEKVAEQTKLELEEKMKRDKLLKEKRDKDRQKEELKQRRIKWESETNQKSDEFYHRLLLKRYGITSWLKLVSMRKVNEDKADKHYTLQIMRKTFSVWLKDARQERSSQDRLINSFYQQILLRRCFHCIKLYRYRFELMEQRADNHYLHTILKKYFHEWRLVNHRRQIRLDKLDVESQYFYNRSLLKRCFVVWKELPVAKRLERDKERRKDAMRQKVASIIPDFNPRHFDKL